MKKGFFILLLLSTIQLWAQDGVFYIAARNGLSLREQPNASSKSITKIPYGQQVTIKYITDNVYKYNAEGLDGMWVSVTYNGQTGYIVDNYLLPTPPPKAGVNDLKQYLEQLSSTTGAPLEIKRSIAELEGGSISLKKQLFKNGAEYHLQNGYEAHTYTFFLPDYNLQQAFVLLRFLSEYKTALGANDVLPSTNTTIKRGETEITVKVETEDYGDGNKRVVRLKLSYEEGALYDIEVFELGNQVVVSVSGGV